MTTTTPGNEPHKYKKYFDGRGEKWDDWLEKFLTVGWERHQLDSGDFRFWSHDDRSVGIEVKSVNDLAGRLSDARRELAQLIDQVEFPILLVWGNWTRRPDNDLLILNNNSYAITMCRVLNLVHTFQNSGLRVELNLTSRAHAFLRINQLYAYYQNPEHTSNLVRRSGGNDKRISLLMGIPGISKELSRRLLERFESLNSIANATTDQLKTSYNIGDSRARVIYDYFHKKEQIR